MNFITAYISASFLPLVKTVTTPGYLGDVLTNMIMLLLGMSINFIVLGSMTSIILAYYEETFRTIHDKAELQEQLQSVHTDPYFMMGILNKLAHHQNLQKRDHLLEIDHRTRHVAGQ
jgi:hypothetical protein